MAKSNRKEKKIRFYQFEIYKKEAELMALEEKYKSLPKGALDLDKDRTNHLHRLKVKMDKIQKSIKDFQTLIDEAKAM